MSGIFDEMEILDREFSDLSRQIPELKDTMREVQMAKIPLARRLYHEIIKPVATDHGYRFGVDISDLSDYGPFVIPFERGEPGIEEGKRYSENFIDRWAKRLFEDNPYKALVFMMRNEKNGGEVEVYLQDGKMGVIPFLERRRVTDPKDPASYLVADVDLKSPKESLSEIIRSYEKQLLGSTPRQM